MCYHSERDAPHWKVDGIAELVEGHPGTQLDPAIADPSYDYVLRKGAPSIFFNTPAAAYFAKNRVDTMIVTGCITSGCVRASIVDSFSLGFRTIVPEDCVGDHELEPHQDNLRDVERRYADVSTADDVIRQIEAWRGRNLGSLIQSTADLGWRMQMRATDAEGHSVLLRRACRRGGGMDRLLRRRGFAGRHFARHVRGRDRHHAAARAVPPLGHQDELVRPRPLGRDVSRPDEARRRCRP